jgi:molybdopterin-containing oxidoreductase family iron-sulfur binding subunit
MNELIQLNASSATGKSYWRSLDQLADTPEFRQWADREFGEGATELTAGSRRSLLKVMAASFGLAGLTACRRPVEKILPHSKGIEGYVHNRAQHYATVLTKGGAASGVIVETIDGRPIKIEGNPRHPASLGATNAHAQAAILSLYDPDRARRVERRGNRARWDEFIAWAKTEFDAARQGDGAGLRILSERSTSLTLAALKGEVLKKFPKAQWVEYDSVNFDQPAAGLAQAFGQPLEAHYQFDKADVVVALDCDFLGVDARDVRPIKQFSARRRVEKPEDAMNRLYVAESNYTLTGAMADHRLRVRAGDAGALALRIAKALNITGTELNVVGDAADRAGRFVAALVKDLLAAKGKSIVVAGPRQPAAVHALVAAVNQALGNNGQTVVYTKPVTEATDSVAAVKQLAAELNAGAVKTLVILGGNPVYTLPADLNFAAAMKKAAATVALLAEPNETWNEAEWRLNEAHPLETWGDARSLDGTASVQQPLISPLFNGHSAIEVAALIAGRGPSKGYDLVKSAWTAQWPAAERERRWKKLLYDGLDASSRLAPVPAALDVKKTLAAAGAAIQPAASGIEIVFYPSHGAYDGRYANNAWMQEAPDPMTKLVWDNAALVSPATAKRLGVANGDVIEISAGGASARVPAMILPGHADDSISLALGYGRTRCGRVGQGVGHRVEGLRTTAGFFRAGAAVTRTGQTYDLVTTQEHHTLTEPITGLQREGIVVEESLAHYREGKIHLPHQPEPASLFKGFDYSKGNQWGIAIDLNACIGCNACLVACQAENNIPVVGKDQVKRGREMHWIRMDRYFSGGEEDPQVVTQPMACVQCENAPCESVCPVVATTHSPEGLNDMAYNRCVGTRYCANNCPYKVRRFNFLDWHRGLTEVGKMAFNPDVTVRMRGVMEKCNYCVQRIQEKKIDAKAAGRRPLTDGEVMSACMQVCPAEAIVFGDINDAESRVAKLKKQKRNYEVLGELNVKPRTTYLAKLRNPNPELEKEHA